MSHISRMDENKLIILISEQAPEVFFKKTEAVTQRCSVEKVFLEISQNSQEKNRMVSTKWTYRKERSFARNYFIFLKILFEYKNLL